MILRFKIFILALWLPYTLFSQTFYNNTNHFSFDVGNMLNHAKSMHLTNEIRPLAAIDFNLSVSYEIFKNKSGWLFTIGGGTQSVRYKYKSLDGSFPSTQTTIGNNGRYYLGIRKTYNFNASNNCNFNLSFGPNLLLNRLTSNFDSLRLTTVSSVSAYNINPIGCAIQTSLRVVFKGKSSTKFYLLAGYQIGLINIREARILTSDLTKEEVFKYKGTGANFGIGLYLSRKNKVSGNS